MLTSQFAKLQAEINHTADKTRLKNSTFSLSLSAGKKSLYSDDSLDLPPLKHIKIKRRRLLDLNEKLENHKNS